MPGTPEFSSDDEVEIRQKQAEFENAAEKHRKQYPNTALGIDPGNSAITREAVTRLVEKNMERVLVNGTGALDPDAIQRVKAELREQVNALFTRKTTP